MELLSDVDAYHWVGAADGQIPDGAVLHGWDTDGAGVWVCQASFSGVFIRDRSDRPVLGSKRTR